MQMRHSLAGIRAIIENEAVAVLLQAELSRNFCSFQKQMAENLVILRRGFSDARNGFFGDQQHMSGRLWFDVAEAEDKFIFKYNLCRNFTSDDSLKKGFAHARQRDA